METHELLLYKSTDDWKFISKPAKGAHTIKKLPRSPFFFFFCFSLAPAPKMVLCGWYFPRHASKLPWPQSPGHRLTSSICLGTYSLLQAEVSHINLSQQDVDRSAPVKNIEAPSKKGLISFASELGLTKQGPLTGDPVHHERISSWGGFLKCSLLSRDW